MKNFNEIVAKLKSKQVTSTKIEVSIFVEKKRIFTQSLENDDFGGGVKSLAKVVNELTLSRKGAQAEIIFNFEHSDVPTSIKFIAGKFAINLKNLVKVAVSQRYGLCIATPISNKLRSEYSNSLYNYFDSNINGIVETVKFINLIENVPLLKLEQSFENFKLISNE